MPSNWARPKNVVWSPPMPSLRPAADALSKLNLKDIYAAHQTIFGDIYDWAGSNRTVTTEKWGIKYPPPKFLDKGMSDFDEKVLQKFPAASLTSDEAFLAAVAEIQGEFLAVHPFRDGNTRTIRLCTNLLAARTGRPLLAYDFSLAGQQRQQEALQAAVCHADYGLLQQSAADALDRGQRRNQMLKSMEGIGAARSPSDRSNNRGRRR